MRLRGADQDREILRHLPLFHRLDADPFERVGEVGHGGRVVELAPVGQATGPGED